jgi:hypothetical protein
MTSPVGRVSATTLALVLFLLTWVVVAAKPWAATTADPRLKQLAVREARLRHEAKLVNQIVARRFAAYHRALATRRTAIASAKAAAAAPAPAVRVVTLPPVTITRTS